MFNRENLFKFVFIIYKIYDMNDNKNLFKDTIKVLESEIEKDQSILNEKIEALIALKKLLPNNITMLNDSSYDESADTQILSLFEKGIIKYAVKRSEIQAVFEKEYHSKKNVGAGLPKLKRTNRLVMVRYNGQKGYSFWGLPSWIEGNTFIDEYRPERKYLPEKIIKVEIVNDEK